MGSSAPAPFHSAWCPSGPITQGTPKEAPHPQFSVQGDPSPPPPPRPRCTVEAGTPARCTRACHPAACPRALHGRSSRAGWGRGARRQPIRRRRGARAPPDSCIPQPIRAPSPRQPPSFPAAPSPAAPTGSTEGHAFPSPPTAKRPLPAAHPPPTRLALQGSPSTGPGGGAALGGGKVPPPAPAKPPLGPHLARAAAAKRGTVRSRWLCRRAMAAAAEAARGLASAHFTPRPSAPPRACAPPPPASAFRPLAGGRATCSRAARPVLRRPGCDEGARLGRGGPHWAVLGHRGLDCTMVGCTALCLAVLDCAALYGARRLYRAVWGHTGLYWAIQECSAPYWAALGQMELYGAVQDCIGPYGAVQGCTGASRTVLHHAKLYSTVLGCA